MKTRRHMRKRVDDLPIPLGDDDEMDDLYIAIPSEELRSRGFYYITGEIGDEVLEVIHQDIFLKHLDSNWKDPLTLIINSPGGTTAACWSLVDLMDYVRMPIHTVGMGSICSAGAILFAAGEKGHRLLSPNCELMVHLPYEIIRNLKVDVADLTSLSSAHKKEYQRHVRFWLDHSNLSDEEDLQQALLKKADTYLTAEEAIELGIADAILTSHKQPPREEKPKKRNRKKKV